MSKQSQANDLEHQMVSKIAAMANANRLSLDCKIARNFDPTFKVSQRIDLVAKYWNWEVHLSRPIVTPPEKWILTSNQ